MPFNAVLEGELLANEYMNSTIKFSAGWLATQALEDAAKSAWGDDFENLFNRQ